MLTEIRPDTSQHLTASHFPKVFLAGSIEMGKAEMWQEQAIKAWNDVHANVYNPRRLDWDSSWAQSTNNTNFTKQVLWEQKHLLSADIVLFYFQDDTKSPISLLELGQIGEYASDKKVIVCCPAKFWKSGNVHVQCVLKGIPLYERIEDAISHVRILLEYKYV